MNCGVCGAENRDDRKFCRECGNPLALACPNCGTHNDPGDKFCGSCGHQLAEAPAPTQPAQPDTASAETRFVSVLFADLVGYTTYAEQRDSEDVRDMLTTYFDRSREIVERFGGTVEKFIGDAVMGVWGATGAREDDAERAVRAGLELVDMVAALAVELDHPELVLRAGVNSGSAVVGPGIDDQGMVVGDLVNTAARLQSIADPGTVFVGATTHSVTSHAIHYESIGERDVKGKTEAVAAWKALRVAGLVGGRLESELRHPPFVGREREMRLLKDELAAVESDQRARMVSIIGEGGVGKTRLGEEFKNYIDGFTDDVYWHQGRSPSYGDGVAFWALGEMVRRRAGIAEGEEPARARTRLRTCVAEFVPGEEDRRWIEPRLEGLLGLAEMPPGGREELFSALRSFFQHISMRGTTVLVFEDLHWADTGLMDFISELADRSTRSPMLIVTLGRPDVLDRHPTWGSQHRNSMSVRLAPLTEDQMREMVTEHLPGVDADVVERIVERSAGFPLYAVEMVRMLVASGDLAGADDEWSFRGDLDSLALPESLQAVIGARLDRLDPAQRSVLQDGAVVGQSFTVSAIESLRGEDGADLEMLLRGLTQLEILDIEDDPRSPERGQYRFVQSLIHEVAYRRLARQDRRDKHLAAAAYFELFDDPELAGVVAGHYMGAFNATPEGPKRDELVSKALQGLADAAARAAALGSHPRAMGLLDQAIELATDEDQVADFRIAAASSAGAQSDVERAIAYVGAALTHFTEMGNLDGERRAATTYSEILNSNYRSDEALAIIRPVYEGLDAVDDPITIGVAAEAGRSLSLNFDAGAIVAIDRLLPGAGALGLDKVTLESLVTQGTTLSWNQRWTEGMVVLRGAALVAEDLGLLRTAGRAYNNLAAISYVDSPRQAAEYALSAIEIVSRLGDLGWTMRATFDRAGNAVREGRYEEGLDYLNSFEEDQLTEFWKATARSNRAFIDLYRGTDPAAADRALEALSFHDHENDPQLRAGIDQAKCQVLELAGRWDEAFDLAMSIDHINTGVGIYEGMQVAAWTRRLDRIELVIRKLDENPNEGRFVDGVHLYATAVHAALTGEKERAVELFDRLLVHLEPIVLGYDLAMVRASYAALVGQDHPAAAAAAQAAQEWLTSTGSDGLAKMWAAGLPASSEAEAAG
ncbi:MAG: AAA family ATPase [Acidimicrobiia bacterium]|nr:AAA family ATPase [Acidimicrobiia bacterium]NNC91138.1 AAA family ATPase [Acidimicrobiia bacterium]